MKRKKVGDSKEANETARNNAETWLTLVDEGDYAGSWEVAAKPLQTAFSKPKWLDAVSVARAAAGALQSRELKSAEYKTSLAEAPDDEYYIIHLGTGFENKPDATEILIMRFEEDTSWKVATYVIK